MELTLASAEKLSEELFRTIEDKKERDFFMLHSKQVADTACILAGDDLNLDINSLKIAGLLHDIGRTIQSDNHAEYSLKILEEKGYEVNDIIKDCILNHGRDKTPETKEGLLIQIADKASIFDKDTLKFIMKNTITEYEIKYLTKMSERGIGLLNKLL